MRFALAALVCGVACIPHPDEDFENYGKRSAPFGQIPVPEAGAGAPTGTPADAGEAVYYGACLSQLAFGATDKVFNFYTKTVFTPGAEAGNGKLVVTLQSLRLDTSPKGPPTKFERAGTVGDAFTSIPAPAEPNVLGLKTTVTFGDVGGRPGLVTVPGEANPITGRPVEIENTKVTGVFSKEKFCGLLSGKVVVPVSLELDPQKNVCKFARVNEGEATPIITNAADFAAATCN